MASLTLCDVVQCVALMCDLHLFRLALILLSATLLRRGDACAGGASYGNNHNVHITEPTCNSVWAVTSQQTVTWCVRVARVLLSLLPANERARMQDVQRQRQHASALFCNSNRDTSNRFAHCSASF